MTAAWNMPAVRLPGWEWPEWVPGGLRGTIEVQWTPRGGQRAWAADAASRGLPELGALIDGGRPANGRRADDRRGRYVHLWGDVGRLVYGDGQVIATVLLAGRLGTFSLGAG